MMNEQAIRRSLATDRKNIRQCGRVFVEVMGPHDLYWVPVSKKAATDIIRDACGQLVSRMCGDHDCVVGSNTCFDDTW